MLREGAVMIVPALVVSAALAGGFAERMFTDFRFSPDGTYLAGAAVDMDTEDRGGSAAIWEVVSGRLVMGHDGVVERFQFHPTRPMIRIIHPFERYDTPVDDVTFHLEREAFGAIGAYPFMGFTEDLDQVYAYTDYQDLDGDGSWDNIVQRVPLFAADGSLAVELGQEWGSNTNELHITAERSWAQRFLYDYTWTKQSAATGEIWLRTQEGLFRLGPKLDAAQRVSASESLGFAMGADGKLIIVDERVVVDAVAGTRHKLPKKLLLSPTVLPGSESVLVLAAEKDRFVVLSSQGELQREFPLEQPLSDDCYAGPSYDNYGILVTWPPCAWHEPTQRLAVHTPGGIRIIDTTTGADVGLLDTGIDVAAVWAEQRRLREIEEEAEHQRSVQHREETRIAVEARLQAEHDYANRPARQLHLRANMGLMEATGNCASVYVDVPMEMSDAEAVQEVRSRLLGAGIRVLSFEEIPPGGESQCPESFSSMDLR